MLSLVGEHANGSYSIFILTRLEWCVIEPVHTPKVPLEGPTPFSLAYDYTYGQALAVFVKPSTITVLNIAAQAVSSTANDLPPEGKSPIVNIANGATHNEPTPATTANKGIFGCISAKHTHTPNGMPAPITITIPLDAVGIAPMATVINRTCNTHVNMITNFSTLVLSTLSSFSTALGQKRIAFCFTDFAVA